MDQLPKINDYEDRWQCLVILLESLKQVGAIRTKQEILKHIHENRFMETSDDDWVPYPTQSEAKWHTMIAWARKDCVLRGWMFKHDEQDSWEITRSGLEFLDQVYSRVRADILHVQRCYLWSKRFKALVNPNYIPSAKDSNRPRKTLSWDEILKFIE